MRYLLCVFLLFTAMSLSATTRLGFVSQPGDWIGQGETRDFDETNATLRVSASSDRSTVTVAVDTPYPAAWRLIFDGPSGVPLTTGRYTDASRYPFNSATSNGLDFSAPGRGCNRLSGEFTIDAISYAADGSLIHLDASFIQVCELFMPALTGYVLIDKRPSTPLTVSFSIEPEGAVYAWGQARIEGEVACTGGDTVHLNGVIRQGAKHVPFSASSGCGQHPSWWSADAAGLKRGWVDVDATATVRRPGNAADFVATSASQRVRLSLE